MERPLKIEEVAEMIGATVPHTRELCRNKEIKAKKVGREWVIYRKDVEEYMGISTPEEDYKRELYIKELEQKVKHYEFILSTVKMSLNNINGVIE